MSAPGSRRNASWPGGMGCRGCTGRVGVVLDETADVSVPRGNCVSSSASSSSSSSRTPTFAARSQGSIRRQVTRRFGFSSRRENVGFEADGST
eukprot:scaffold80867_cov69-Phaeocystis_antarctica.AAC.2